MYGIRLHGRGGQLIEEASHVLASAFMMENWFVQLSPSALTWRDRVGLHRVMFLKIDEKEFNASCQVVEPHCVVICDDKLPRVIEAYAGIRRDGMIVINTPDTEAVSNADVDVARVVSLDADDITSRVYSSEIVPPVGPVMIGAFAKGFSNLKLASVKDAIEASFTHNTRKHINAVEIAYDETCVRVMRDIHQE